MQIVEAVSGAGLLLFAVFAKRELPTEQQTQFRESTRKLLLVSAPGTLDAAGNALQENREILRLLSPLGFFAGLVTHCVQRGRELQPVPAKQRTVQMSPVPAAPSAQPAAAPASAPPPAEFAVRDPAPGTFFGTRKMPKLRTWSGSGAPPWPVDATE